MDNRLYGHRICLTVLIGLTQVDCARSPHDPSYGLAAAPHLTHADLTPHGSPDGDTAWGETRSNVRARRDSVIGEASDCGGAATEHWVRAPPAARMEAVVLGAFAGLVVQAILQIFAALFSAPNAITLLSDHSHVQAYAIRLADANSVLRVVLAFWSLVLAFLEVEWDRSRRAYRISLALPALADPERPMPDFAHWASAAQAVYLVFGAGVSVFLQSLPAGFKDLSLAGDRASLLAAHSILCSVTRTSTSLVLFTFTKGALLDPSVHYGHAYAHACALVLNCVDFAVIGGVPVHLADAAWPMSFVGAYLVSHAAYYGLMETHTSHSAFGHLFPWVTAPNVEMKTSLLIVTALVPLLHAVQCLLAALVIRRESLPSVSCVCFLRTRFQGVSQSVSFAYPQERDEVPGSAEGSAPLTGGRRL